jgi:hypothetical protein
MRFSAVDGSPSDSNAKLAQALNVAVSKNITYAYQWLDEKDFKSLAQTAEGLTVLAQCLSRWTEDDRSQKGVAELEQLGEKLKAAADKEHAALSRLLLYKVGTLNKELSAIRVRNKPSAPKRPTIPLRSFMALLDGTHADAKAALTLGEIDQAKQAANALAELGQALSTFHAEAEWTELAGRLTAEAKKTADSASRDAKEIREQLRAIYQRCETCHDERR